MRVITSRDAALKGAKDETGRRVFAVRPPDPPVDKHLAALERIGKVLDTLAAKPGNDSLRPILVELAAQTALIAEMVAALARQASSNPQPPPVRGFTITARDENDRISAVTVDR